MAEKINLLYGTETNFTTTGKIPANVKGSLYLTTVDDARSHLYFGDGTNFLNIVPKLLSVANGGTGHDTLAAGKALIGNGTSAVSLRSITNNTSLKEIAASTNLITANTLAYWNGAFDSAGTSRITYVGTISRGVWNGTTITVGYGGTGCTTFTTNGIPYGNGVEALQVTAAGTEGQVFIAKENGVPGFITPTISWANGSSAGPIITLTFDTKSYTATIPSASGTISGIVTTAAQTFAGNKTFEGNIISKNIYPASGANYSSGTASNPWAVEYTKSLQVLDANKVVVGQFKSTTAGTTSATGISALYIGNSTATGTAGNSKGRIILYSTDATYRTLESEAGASVTITFPKYAGYATVSSSSVVDPTSETTYRLPFYTTNYKVLGSNTGLTAKLLKATSSTSAGSAKLVIGAVDSSTPTNNKKGSLTMYAAYGEAFTLTPNPAQVTEATNITDYTLYLPVPSAATGGELMFHDQNTAIGSNVRPVYVQTNGKPAQIDKVDVKYGGTGATTFTSKGVLYGQGTSAILATAAGTQGQILTANSSGVPIFASPTFEWTDGNSAGPKLNIVLSGKTWTTESVPSASATISGIVTTGNQSFAGIKTFENTTDSTSKTTGAVIVKGGVGIANTLYVGGSANIEGSCTVSGDIFGYGSDLYLGSSSTKRVRFQYTDDATLGDTITLTFLD